MKTIECCNCGVAFGVPDTLYGSLRETKRDFWCPNGHRQAYTESEADKLRRERDRLKQNAAYLSEQVAAQIDRRIDAERRLAATRGVVTKLKARAAHGVCPCCSRTFTNMARHMATKHPEFSATDADAPKEG